MPILPAEPDLYPLGLWDGVRAEDDNERRWWCLHTKPRQEKASARHLFGRRIAYYLPQVVQESRTPGGRKIRSIIPLFQGYLFMLGDDRQRIDALMGNTLVKVLEVVDQADLAHDLEQIHRLLSSGLPVVPEPSHPVGSRIRILSGPLVGLIGPVVRRGRRDQFVVVVNFLGRGATIDLRDWQVERIDG
jgi:transcription antitermination factor NusG